MVTLMPPTSAYPGSHSTFVSCGLSFNQSQSYSEGFSPGPPGFPPSTKSTPNLQLIPSGCGAVLHAMHGSCSGAERLDLVELRP